MGFSHEDWAAIDKRIAELTTRGPLFTQGEVIKADENRNVVWLAEFGDQPIPLFAFDYNVSYYDTQPIGNVTAGQPVNTQLMKKTAVITPKCPKVGDVVLVARQYGSRRLPKCLGVLRSFDFIIPAED